MLVFRTQLAVTHIHDLAFEWSVYRVRLIFYCSKRHMALMAVKGVSLLRYSGSSANFDSLISLFSCISKVKFKNLYQSNPRLHGSRVRLQVYIKNLDPSKT